MRFAVIESSAVINIAEAAQEFGDSQGWIPAEDAKIGDHWDGDKFTSPGSIVVVPESIAALQGLLALDEEGLSESYDAWANSGDRTFSEKAFINKALNWKRKDPVLLSGAAALGLSSDDLDALFIKASKTKVSNNGS